MAKKTITMKRTLRNGEPHLDKEGNEVIKEMTQDQVDNLRKLKGHSGWSEVVETSEPKKSRKKADKKSSAKGEGQGETPNPPAEETTN